MMWNVLVGGLLIGTTCVLYDGSPGYPDMNALWRLAQDTSITYFGTSAPYVAACMKAGVEPGRDFDLRCAAWHRVDGVASAAGVLWLGLRAREAGRGARLGQRRDRYLHSAGGALSVAPRARG